jgi:hypothetical protein
MAVICTKGVHKLFAPIAGAPGSDSSLQKGQINLIKLWDLGESCFDGYRMNVENG